MKKNIYHGSDHIIQTPSLNVDKYSNDFGRGFYCTENLDLSNEWACKNNTNGFSNRYELDTDKLNILNLNSDEYNILNWLAILTKYRGYWQRSSIGEQAKDFLWNNYFIDINKYDVIIGYRADDSYFSFAQDFITGTISLRQLSKAMMLGYLGEQIVLKSQRAFDQLIYIDSSLCLAEEYYVKKINRDNKARAEYIENRKATDFTNDIFILDILRGKVNKDDLFI